MHTCADSWKRLHFTCKQRYEIDTTNGSFGSVASFRPALRQKIGCQQIAEATELTQC